MYTMRCLSAIKENGIMSFAGRCLQLKTVIVSKFPVDTQKGRGRDKKRQCKGSRHQRKCVIYNIYSGVVFFFKINAKNVCRNNHVKDFGRSGFWELGEICL